MMAIKLIIFNLQIVINFIELSYNYVTLNFEYYLECTTDNNYIAITIYTIKKVTFYTIHLHLN